MNSAKTSYNKLITAAARTHLSPYGCAQKGRSRVWLLDRIWFVSVVEFQPSSFGKGIFLNVGAHFLWTDNDHLSFDLGYRIEEFEAYESDDQFAEVANRYALRALAELQVLDAKLPRPGAAAAVLPKSTSGDLSVRVNRAISHALGGETSDAIKLLESLVTRPQSDEWQKQLGAHCAQLLVYLKEPELFRAHIAKMIDGHRLALGLPSAPGQVASSLSRQADT